MPETYRKLGFIPVLCCLMILYACPGIAGSYEFSVLEKSYANFIRCELTRTSALDLFEGKPFKITMIDLFDVQEESGLKIVTGAVQCFVGQKHKTLYAAVGVKPVMEKEQVLYFSIRKKDFSILATELIRFPYKERCGWGQYWIDTD